MLLVLTHSSDFTTDMVLSRLPEIPVFRFNIDLWKDYQWKIGPDDFVIEDPVGRHCDQDSIRAVYLRKLLQNPVFIDIPAGGSEEHWRREELLQIWLGLRDWAHGNDLLAVVKPSPNGRWNKIRQMKLAREFFSVPEWRMIRGCPADLEGPSVIKTLAVANTGGGGLMMVRQVDPLALHPDYPWFLQQKPQGITHDVTVAWVAGRQFAFEVDRRDFTGDDVRIATFENDLPWSPVTLTPEEHSRIDAFMRKTGLEFGRLDFLRSEVGLWFLEVNPNGQFAWLDPNGEYGLLDAVANEIRRVWLANGPAPVR